MCRVPVVFVDIRVGAKRGGTGVAEEEAKLEVGLDAKPEEAELFVALEMARSRVCKLATAFTEHISLQHLSIHFLLCTTVCSQRP